MNAAKQKTLSSRVRSVTASAVDEVGLAILSTSNAVAVEVMTEDSIGKMDDREKLKERLKSFHKALKSESDAMLQACLGAAELYANKDWRKEWVEDCASRYDWSQTTTYERAYAGIVFGQLLDFGFTKNDLPNFSQALELWKIDAVDRVEVWQQLVQGSGRITLNAVNQAISALKGSSDAPPPPDQDTFMEAEESIAIEPVEECPVSFESVPEVRPISPPASITNAIKSDEVPSVVIVEVDEGEDENDEEFEQLNFDAYTALKNVVRQFSTINSLKWSESAIGSAADRLYQELTEMAV